MPSGRLNILAYRDRYQTLFMTPRKSRHIIRRVRFVPFNRIDTRLDGITMTAPHLWADLLHAHNRIPVAARKFIISFESHLPRRFAIAHDNAFTRYMNGVLEGPSCRRIVAMSHFAKRAFLQQHAANPDAPLLAAKLFVRHPNVVVPPEAEALSGDRGPGDPLKLVFVGAHFGRKGGCVAVKIAEMAAARNLPVHVTIVSALDVAGDIWTDPAERSFFEPYLRLLNLPNVRFHGALPNAAVRALLRQSHFSLLPTFADTFGFSAIESMAEGTPVIATRICALPEFINDGENGMLLDLETTDIGEWRNPGWDARGTQAFARHFRDEVERLAEEIVARLERLSGRPAELAAMQLSAHRTAKRMFDADAAAAFWDDLYTRVAQEAPRMPPQLSSGSDISSPEHYSAMSG